MSKQEQKSAVLDRYFEAWARTLVEQAYEHIVPNLGKDGADDKTFTDLIKQELSDAWHRRAGDGAPPEVVAFIAEHDPMRQLDALPFLDKSNPIGDLIQRFKMVGDALSERDLIIRRECERFDFHVDGITNELKAANIIAENEFSDNIIEDVQRMREELTECREMIGALLGIEYTREGARSAFQTRVITPKGARVEVSQDAPTRPDAPQSMRNIIGIAEKAYSGHVKVTYESLHALLEREQHLSRQVTELQLANNALVEERRAYDLTSQVRELFTVVLPDQERLERPGIPTDATMRFRVRLVAEEFIEMLDSVFGNQSGDGGVECMELESIQDAIRSLVDNGRINIDLPEFIDALGDLKVVIEGAFVACGVDSRPIQLAIHHANMAKKDGPKRESDGKRLKPPGWKPADIEGELRKQGWSGNG